MKLSHLSWQGNIFTKKSLLFYIGDIQKNAYFQSCGHHGRISHVENFGEFGPWRYGLRSSTGVYFKIWGGQQKTS